MLRSHTQDDDNSPFPEFDSDNRTEPSYEKSLRTRSISSLITEMEILKQQVEVTKKEIYAATVLDAQLHLINYSENLRGKLLAVQVEIGRRLQQPKFSE